MRDFFALAAFLGYMVFFFVVLRNTVFSISLQRSFFGGVLIFREIFLLVLLGVVLLEVVGLRGFKLVYATEYSLGETSLLIFVSVGLLLIAIALFSKTVFRRYLRTDIDLGFLTIAPYGTMDFLIRAVAILLGVFVVLAHASGATHAFLTSILSGESLMRLRLANRYEAAVPSHIVTYMRYAFLLLALLLGLFGKEYLSRVERFLYIFLVLYAATLFGAKAPLIQVLMFYFIGTVSSGGYSGFRVAATFSVFVVFIFGVIFFIAKVQYPDLDAEGFLVFLADRLGVGQIQGVYEQFALRLSDWRYILIEVPFSGFFTDPPDFSKDLMMKTLGFYSHQNDIGVMNSFFIGEAYAIGGYPLVFAAPFAVAFFFCMICAMTVLVLYRYLGVGQDAAKQVAPLFVSSVLMFTGDLNGLLFGKKLFVIAFFLLMIYVVYRSCLNLRNVMRSR